MQKSYVKAYFMKGNMMGREFPREILEEFIVRLIEKNNRGRLNENARIRLDYDVISPLYFMHDTEKSASNFLRYISSARKDERGKIFFLPDGIL